MTQLGGGEGTGHRALWPHPSESSPQPCQEGTGFPPHLQTGEPGPSGVHYVARAVRVLGL